MTIRQKIVIYIGSLLLFTLWEAAFLGQILFRSYDSVYLVGALFGIGGLLYMVRIIRHAPIERE